MKLGVVLPTFRWTMAEALAKAAACAAAGIDGVFAYDHLFPINAPERPAFAPFALLARVAHLHPTLMVGPLVARVGMASPSQLAGEFWTLDMVAPGRVIAGIGTGDALSAKENAAWGLPVASADDRRAAIREVAQHLPDGMPLWIGGGAPATVAVARDLGAELNLWNATPQDVAQAASDGPVNFAGPVPEDLGGTLDALESAGATWAICAPNVDIEALSSWRREKTL